MYRIDDATAGTSMPTPEAAGSEGYWIEGNPATGTPATKIRASWLNMIQEELRAIVVAAGLTPSKTTYTQVRDAIKALYGSGRLLGAPQVFTSSGTYTRNPLASFAIGYLVGGGGGTGGAPATGGAQFSGSPGSSSGAIACVYWTAAQIGASQAVTVGAAGTAGGVGSSTGGNGGTTTVGSLASAPGGQGSSSFGPSGATVAFAGPPGLAGNPTISVGTLIYGGRGNQGAPVMGSTGGGIIAGNAGASPLAGGTFGAGATGTAIGASAAAAAGFAGTPGVFIVYEYA